MKRNLAIVGLILIVVIIVIFVINAKKPASTVNPVIPVQNGAKTEQDQVSIVANANKLTSEKDLIKYIDDNIKYLSKENADTVVLDLENLQNKKLKQSQDDYLNKNIPTQGESFLMDSTQQKMSKEFGTPSNGRNLDINSKIDKVADADLKDFLIGVRDSGYKVYMSEGIFDEMTDYDFYKKYDDYLTPDIKEYIDIESLESDNPLTDDGCVVIPMDEIYNRAARCEKFVSTYPNSVKTKEIQSAFDNYYMCYFNPYNAFDTVTNKLKDDVKASYLKAYSLDPSTSKIAKTMKDYMQVLQKNNFEKTKAVDIYVSKLM